VSCEDGHARTRFGRPVPTDTRRAFRHRPLGVAAYPTSLADWRGAALGADDGEVVGVLVAPFRKEQRRVVAGGAASFGHECVDSRATVACVSATWPSGVPLVEPAPTRRMSLAVGQPFRKAEQTERLDDPARRTRSLFWYRTSMAPVF